jgi:hypothetical protein
MNDSFVNTLASFPFLTFTVGDFVLVSVENLHFAQPYFCLAVIDIFRKVVSLNTAHPKLKNSLHVEHFNTSSS